MNIYAFSSLVAAIFVFFILLLVLLKANWQKVRLLFGAFLFVLLCWIISCFVQSYTSKSTEAIFWDKILYLSITWAPLIYLYFMDSLKIILLRRKMKFTLWLFAVFFTILNLSSWRHLFIKGVIKRYPFRFIALPNFLWFFLIVYFSLIGLGIIYLYINFIRQTKYALRRTQVQYLLISFLILSVGAYLYFGLVVNIRTPPLDNLLVVIFSIITTYAISRYHLLDIKLAFVRVALFIIVYLLVLGLPFALGVFYNIILVGKFGSKWWMIPLVLMAMLATIGPFIYQYLRVKTEEFLLAEQRRYQRTLRELSKTMMRIRDLEHLVKAVLLTVVNTVKVSH
ncbi:MAG: hypothetical protein N2712_07910, partial [Brevinematales bacterium]|nr:hypothetical protein [Brevinematales bacterium]